MMNRNGDEKIRTKKIMGIYNNAYTRSYSHKIKLAHKTQTERIGTSNNDLPVSIQAWYAFLAAATGKGSPDCSASSRISVNTIIPCNTW